MLYCFIFTIDIGLNEFILLVYYFMFRVYDFLFPTITLAEVFGKYVTTELKSVNGYASAERSRCFKNEFYNHVNRSSILYSKY